MVDYSDPTRRYRVAARPRAIITQHGHTLRDGQVVGLDDLVSAEDRRRLERFAQPAPAEERQRIYRRLAPRVAHLVTTGALVPVEEPE